MTDLREQLLKAGLVTKAEANAAAKKQSGERRKKGWRRDRQDRATAAEERESNRQERLEAQRRLDAEQTDVRETAARDERVRRTVAAHQISGIYRGSVTWYFEARNDQILCVRPDDSLAKQLGDGRAAIVQGPGPHEVHIVTAEGARTIAAADARWIRFWTSR